MHEEPICEGFVKNMCVEFVLNTEKCDGAKAVRCGRDIGFRDEGRNTIMSCTGILIGVIALLVESRKTVNDMVRGMLKHFPSDFRFSRRRGRFGG